MVNAFQVPGASLDTPDRETTQKAIRSANAPGSTPTLLPTRRFLALVIVLSLVIGLLARLPYIAPPGFPLGEGGLFVRFSQLILDSNFALPTTVDYGDQTLPFAYPPAGFYLAAALAWLTRTNLLTIFYWTPIFLNLLAMPAFCLLAARLTNDRVATFSAAVVYVLLPHSFVWQITGGGLPRALAALFTMLAVTVALGTGPTLKKIAWSGVFVGLAALSHLEWGIMAAVGVALVFVSNCGLRAGLIRAIGAGVVSALLVGPWIAIILARYGLDPFISSSSASEWNFAQAFAQLVTGQVFGLLTWPALIGAAVNLRTGRWFIFAWLVTIAVLTPRMGASAGLAIPAAVLAGVGLKQVNSILTERMLKDPDLGEASRARITGRTIGIGLPTLFLVLLTALVLGGPLKQASIDMSVDKQLTLGSREAMEWIRTHTDPGSRFAVISDAPAWWADRTAEWFPLLASRHSVTTIQGLEWAGPGVFTKKRDKIWALKLVQKGDPALLPSAIASKTCEADFVAVFLPLDDPARRAFTKSASFQLVFHNPEAAVLQTVGTKHPC